MRKEKFLFFLILILFLLVSFFLSLVFLTTKRQPPKITKFSSPTLSLTPNKGTFKSGKNFTVEIIVDSKSYQSSAVGARLNFPPEFLEVLEIVPGNIFGLYPAKKFDNKIGKINISGLSWNVSLGKPGIPFSGKATFAKIKFLVKPVVKKTIASVNFYFLNFGNTTDSNIMEAKTAKDVLGKVKNCQFTLIP